MCEGNRNHQIYTDRYELERAVQREKREAAFE